jgi:tetratricopeptide (TPR) repeat protein
MRVFIGLIFVVAVCFLDAQTSAPALAPALEEARRSYQQGKLDDALAALARFEKSGAPTPDSLDLRGSIYMEQKKFEDAAKAYNDAHTLAPDVFAPRIHLCDLLFRQKKFEEARNGYLVLIKESNVLMWNERLRYGVLLTYLGEHNDKDAKAAFDSITFPTETPAYYYAQAAWAFAHGKQSEAEKWIAQADSIFERDLIPWFARPLYELGWLKKKPPVSSYSSY